MVDIQDLSIDIDEYINVGDAMVIDKAEDCKVALNPSPNILLTRLDITFDLIILTEDLPLSENSTKLLKLSSQKLKITHLNIQKPN
ncbi:unnamed protein product [Leptidea sinapis]|uniref:Uncharacterized protein n=1 Tax=Leptidea sinapis TaxID=189913 RepID=A0A5E4PLH2_9NEOP|nr:unnamed protein product [Leptidea sinapis]